MRTVPSSLTLTLALGLAAVAGAVGPAAAQSPAASGEVPAASAPATVGDRRLADAVAATVATDSVRTTFDIVFQGSSMIPDGTTITGSGQTNFGLERRMRLSLDMSALGVGAFDLILDGTALFIRGLPLGDLPADQWVTADLTSENPLAVPLRALASGNNDASLLLYFLLGATGPAETVGTEDVDGVAATHLRTTVDLDRALALVPDEMRETLAANVAEVREGGVDPVLAADVWVDEAELVQRVVFGYTLGAPMGGGGMTVTFDFREHGAPLDLGVPAPEEVVDIESL